jgi:hypothetical protein
MRCAAFADEPALAVRARHPLRCPCYVEGRSPFARETHPPGWLKRAVRRFQRWVW